MLGIVLAVVTLLIIISGPLIYHFLVFPNIDGVVQDLEWYNYDGDSQHFIYWTGFWAIIILSAIGGSSVAKTKVG